MNKKMLLSFGMALTMMSVSVPAMAGDATAGEKYFDKKCKMCHPKTAGKHTMGPSLAGIMSAKAGSTNFKKYKGLKDADFTWDDASMDEFLADPSGFLGKKSSMKAKTKKASDRANLITYMKTLK